MPSDDHRPLAPAVFSKREVILLTAAGVTIVATLTVLRSGVTLDDAYITFRYARLGEGMDSAHGIIPASTSKATHRCCGRCCSRRLGSAEMCG